MFLKHCPILTMGLVSVAALIDRKPSFLIKHYNLWRLITVYECEREPYVKLEMCKEACYPWLMHDLFQTTLLLSSKTIVG